MILPANSGLSLSGKPVADPLDSDRHPYRNYAYNFLVLLDYTVRSITLSFYFKTTIDDQNCVEACFDIMLYRKDKFQNTKPH